MYTLSGISEFANTSRVAWSQALLDSRWDEIGAAAPAPRLPASMAGWFSFATRGVRMLTPRAGSNKGARRVSAEENNFLNLWNKVAVDPYLKQSALSKVAGGILTVAAVALPVLSYAKAGADLANAGLALNSAKTDAPKLQAFVSSGADAQNAADVERQKSELATKLSALNALASPPSNGTPVFGFASAAPSASPKSSTLPLMLAGLGLAAVFLFKGMSRAHR